MVSDGALCSNSPFLLADFSSPRRNERIVDLGAGVGVIGLLLAQRHPTVRVTGIELQPSLARHAAENARASGLQARFQVFQREHQLLASALHGGEFVASRLQRQSPETGHCIETLYLLGRELTLVGTIDLHGA